MTLNELAVGNRLIPKRSGTIATEPNSGSKQLGQSGLISSRHDNDEMSIVYHLAGNDPCARREIHQFSQFSLGSPCNYLEIKAICRCQIPFDAKTANASIINSRDDDYSSYLKDPRKRWKY